MTNITRENSTHIRVEKSTRLRLRAARRPGEKSDSDTIDRLLETQKRVDVIGLKNAE
jgi:hypothetical protein